MYRLIVKIVYFTNPIKSECHIEKFEHKKLHTLIGNALECMHSNIKKPKRNHISFSINSILLSNDFISEIPLSFELFRGKFEYLRNRLIHQLNFFEKIKEEIEKDYTLLLDDAVNNLFKESNIRFEDREKATAGLNNFELNICPAFYKEADLTKRKEILSILSKGNFYTESTYILEYKRKYFFDFLSRILKWNNQIYSDEFKKYANGIKNILSGDQSLIDTISYADLFALIELNPNHLLKKINEIKRNQLLNHSGFRFVGDIQSSSIRTVKPKRLKKK